MTVKKELKLVIIAILTGIAALIIAGATTGCAFHMQRPDDDPTLITPMATYYAAQGGMIALANENATVASIVCAAASEKIWPILESASGATIELKDEVISILIEAAASAGLKDEWLAYMAPALGLLNEVFNPEVVFQDGWLPILKGFVGGVVDTCMGTDTHKPEEKA